MRILTPTPAHALLALWRSTQAPVGPRTQHAASNLRILDGKCETREHAPQLSTTCVVLAAELGPSAPLQVLRHAQGAIERAGNADAAVIVAPTSTLKTWRAIVDAQWPAPVASARVMTPARFALDWLRCDLKSTGDVLGHNVLAAALDNGMPSGGAARVSLLSAAQARALLQEHVALLPPSPFLPPSDPLRFMGALHRTFTQLTRQGVCVAPDAAPPPGLDGNMWALYKAWWRVKGEPPATQHAHLALPACTRPCTRLRHTESNSCLEYEDISSLLLSVLLSAEHPQLALGPQTTPLHAQRTHLRQALAAAASSAGEAPLVVDMHAMSPVDAAVMCKAAEAAPSPPTHVTSALLLPRALQGDAGAAAPQGDAAAPRPERAWVQLLSEALHPGTQAGHGAVHVSGPSKAARPFAAAACVTSPAAQAQAAAVLVEAALAADTGALVGIASTSRDSAFAAQGAIAQRLPQCVVERITPRSLGELPTVAAVLNCLRLAFLPCPQGVAAGVLRNCGLQPVVAEEVASQLAVNCGDRGDRWLLAAEEYLESDACPPHHAQALAKVLRLLDLATASASPSQGAHALLEVLQVPEDEGHAFISLAQAMEEGLLQPALASASTSRQRLDAYGRFLDGLEAACDSTPQATSLLPRALEAGFAPHPSPRLPGVLMGSPEALLQCGATFTHVILLDASARSWPGATPRPPIPLDMDPTPSWLPDTAADVTAQPRSPEAWADRQAGVLAGLVACTDRSAWALAPAASTVARVPELSSQQAVRVATARRTSKVSPHVLQAWGLTQTEAVAVQEQGAPSPASGMTLGPFTDALPYISMSRLNEFGVCPQRYKLSHIDGIRGASAPVAQYGKALHHVAALLGHMQVLHEAVAGWVPPPAAATALDLRERLAAASSAVVVARPTLASRAEEQAAVHEEAGRVLAGLAAAGDREHYLLAALREAATAVWPTTTTATSSTAATSHDKQLRHALDAALQRLASAAAGSWLAAPQPTPGLVSVPLAVEMPLAVPVATLLAQVCDEATLSALPPDFPMVGVLDRVDALLHPDTGALQTIVATDFKCAQQWRGPSLHGTRQAIPPSTPTRKQLLAYTAMLRQALPDSEGVPILARVGALEVLDTLGPRHASPGIEYAEQLWKPTVRTQQGLAADILNLVSGVASGAFPPSPSAFKCRSCHQAHACEHAAL